MDFDSAIKAHAAWKQKLNAYIRNPDGSLDPTKVSLDNQCELGKWIHEELRHGASNSEMQDLMRTHAEFHKAAGEVVRKVNAGEDVSAEVCLGAQSAFGTTSRAVINRVMQLSKKAA